MSLIRYNQGLAPNRFRATDALLDDFMDIFEFFDPMSRANKVMKGPKTNVENLDGKHVITMATPGVSREDIKVDVDNSTLTVSFASETSENSNFNFQSSFSRSWSLGDNINLDDIAADYQNGILSIEIPKASKAEPVTRRSEIG